MDWLDWLLLVARVVLVFFGLLISVLLYIWFERKVIADFQTRKGPMRAGPRGILVTLADGIKLFFKEGIVPTNADRRVYLLAPVLAMFPAFLAFSTIPFGTDITVFGREVPLQLVDLDIGILWVLAMTSIAVYGVVLAGWASGSNYPLLGAVRSTAQMISYEVAMGLVARRRADVQRRISRSQRSSPRRIACGTWSRCSPRSWSISSAGSPRRTGRRSTSPRPRPSSSPASTPSTRGSRSRCSSWASTSRR